MPHCCKTPQTGQVHGRRTSRGFTLLELLVVVAIIAVLAGIAIPLYTDYVDEARVTVAIGTLDTIRKTLESFHIDNQDYPQNIDFATGLDPNGQVILPAGLRDQINSDLTDPLYNTATTPYVITARAKDRAQTLLTMTPQQTTKAP